MDSSLYRTTQNDTWDSIAYKLFNNEMHLVDILKANPTFADVVIFPADVELVIPRMTKKIKEINPAPWI